MSSIISLRKTRQVTCILLFKMSQLSFVSIYIRPDILFAEQWLPRLFGPVYSPERRRQYLNACCRVAFEPIQRVYPVDAPAASWTSGRTEQVTDANFCFLVCWSPTALIYHRYCIIGEQVLWMLQNPCCTKIVYHHQAGMRAGWPSSAQHRGLSWCVAQ